MKDIFSLFQAHLNDVNRVEASSNDFMLSVGWQCWFYSPSLCVFLPFDPYVEEHTLGVCDWIYLVNTLDGEIVFKFDAERSDKSARKTCPIMKRKLYQN